jgi:hypothetical protein
MVNVVIVIIDSNEKVARVVLLTSWNCVCNNNTINKQQATNKHNKKGYILSNTSTQTQACSLLLVVVEVAAYVPAKPPSFLSRRDL